MPGLIGRVSVIVGQNLSGKAIYKRRMNTMATDRIRLLVKL